ncbi:MFS transporter [Glycomyces tarimensis]
MLSNGVTPLYVVWQFEFGFSRGTITAVFTWYMVGLGVSLLVSGLVSDRFGRKVVLIPALGLAMVAAVVFATASGVASLSLARVLTGIASGALVSAGTAAISDLAGPGRKRLAAVLGSVGLAVGSAIGPLLAGILAETAPGPTVTIFIVEIVLLGTAIAVVARAPLGRPADRGGGWVRVPRVPRPNRRELFLGVAAAGTGMVATAFVLSLSPSLLAELLDTDNLIVAGTVAFVAFVASTGGQFALRGLRLRTLLWASATATGSCMAALIGAVHAASVPLLVVAAVFAGLGQGLGMLGGLALLNRDIPSERLAEANAALNIGVYAVAGSLTLSVGYLSDAIGFGDAVTVFGLAMIALAALSAALTWASRRLPALRD